MHKLFYSPGACSLAPHIALEEIGRPYETEIVKAGTDTQTPAWKAQNPKGRVPALTGVPGRIGGTEGLLTECTAILWYLARTHPEAGLLPKDIAGEARVLEWMNWLATIHASNYARISRPARFVTDESLFPALGAKGRADLADNYAYIDGLLGDGRDWAVPGAYSIVDIYLMVFWHFGRRVSFDMTRTYPAWAAHAVRVLQRPAVARIVEKEGLNLAP